jgi:hypothetical protein
LRSNPDLDSTIHRSSLDLAIESREPILRYLPAPLAHHVVFGTWPKFDRCKLLRAMTQASRHVGAVHSDFSAIEVHPANENVRVRMLGVVMVDGCPFELPPEVAFDSRHELANVIGEVELVRVLG